MALPVKCFVSLIPGFSPYIALGVGKVSAISRTVGTRPFENSADRIFSLAVGVPTDNPDALAAVRRSDVGSSYITPLRIVPDFGKAPENSIKSPSSERADVLHDRIARSYLANEARVLKPESRANPRDPGTLTGEGDILT
jgi:hypothetical protein